MQCVLKNFIFTDDFLLASNDKNPFNKMKVKRTETVEVHELFENVIAKIDDGTQNDLSGLENIITSLFPQKRKPYLMYDNVPWTLCLRKEVLFI